MERNKKECWPAVISNQHSINKPPSQEAYIYIIPPPAKGQDYQDYLEVFYGRTGFGNT
nr:MAG TPA: hypothetical protein [Caudoviricetes sp.]